MCFMRCVMNGVPGNATDYAQLKCARNEAHFVVCSCCVGKIKLNDEAKDEIAYPRSECFQQYVSLGEFEELSRVADHNETDYGAHCKSGEQRKLCKTVLELDRCLCAMQTGRYSTVLLTQIVPYKGHGGHSTSPKNDVIVGVASRDKASVHKAIRGLFGGKALHLNMFE